MTDPNIALTSKQKVPALPSELRRAAKISTSGYWAGVLLEAADEIEAARRQDETTASDWQPIETAPTDGTEFIVFHKEAGVCACFRTGPESNWYCMDGWNTYVNADGSKRPGLTSFVEPPERWMPMPKPPAVKASAELPSQGAVIHDNEDDYK